MIDKTLILISAFSFFIFVAALTILVRMRGHWGILLWMQRIFLVLLVGSSVSVWYIFSDVSIDNKIILLIANFFLTGALSFAYIDGFFGLPLTSLRIELLTTIVRAGHHGIREQDLLKRYTKPSIIRRRLFRLETSGEIVRVGDRYMLRSFSSYFMLHTFVLLGLLVLYKPFHDKKIHHEEYPINTKK